MRAFFAIILLVFCGITTIMSCSKEEITEPSSNSNSSSNSAGTTLLNFIQLDNFNTSGASINNIYELTQGFAINKGKINSTDIGYKFQIILSSPEMILHTNSSGVVDSTSGSEFAQFVVIDLFSLDSNKIALGNYPYTGNNSGITFNFSDNFIQIGNSSGQNGLVFDDILEGEASIIENNNEHEIYFYSKHTDWDSNGVITAHYKGPFEYYNE